MVMNGLSINAVAYTNMQRNNGIKTSVAKKDVKNSYAQTNPLKSYPLGYIPYQINFEGGEYAKLPGIIKLKKLGTLPCPYCGTKMVSSETFSDLMYANSKIPKTIKSFVNSTSAVIDKLNKTEKKVLDELAKIAQKEPNKMAPDVLKNYEDAEEITNEFLDRAYRPMNTREYSAKIMNILTSVEDRMLPVQASVFQKIKKFYAENPTKSIQDAVSAYRPEAFKNLQKTQDGVFDKIILVAGEKFADKSDLNKIKRIISDARRTITKNLPGEKFARKEFLRDIKTADVSSKNAPKLKELLEIAKTLPTSENNADAFIVKYSNLKNPTQFERSNQEIAQKLVEGAVYSVEHIKPQVTFKVGKDKYLESARDNMSNLILAHRACNSERDCLTLAQYMDVNPTVQKNVQKQLDVLADEIKKGNLTGMESYPYGIAQSYIEGSEGRIKLDLSKFDEMKK